MSQLGAPGVVRARAPKQSQALLEHREQQCNGLQPPYLPHGGAPPPPAPRVRQLAFADSAARGSVESGAAGRFWPNKTLLSFYQTVGAGAGVAAGAGAGVASAAAAGAGAGAGAGVSDGAATADTSTCLPC